MTTITREISIGNETLILEVVVDPRLRTMARWALNGKTVRLRIPRGTSRKDVERLISDIIPRIAQQRKRTAHQTDRDLMARAQTLNLQYFNGELSWNSIRWVNNMKLRLGSCTTGGATDGDIRISERIRSWPQYVVDYILAHEICHRKYPNHSSEFWQYLARYPFTEKALGFIDGIAYAGGHNPDEMLE
jgi:predicted metal-dependent hydrolase